MSLVISPLCDLRNIASQRRLYFSVVSLHLYHSQFELECDCEVAFEKPRRMTFCNFSCTNFFHSALLVFQESSYLSIFLCGGFGSRSEKFKINLPGLFSVLPLRPPHNRTFDMRTRICFWQRDLLLLGHGLRLLAIGRLAWSSLTARFCLMRELASAAIFPPPLTYRRGGSACLRDPLWMHSSFYQQHKKIKSRVKPRVESQVFR